MTYVIDGCKIESCLRCQSTNLLVGYPVLVCLSCHAINSVANQGTSAGPCVAFNVGEYRVRITTNKSYINDQEIDTVLPYDISSEDKLRTYLIFS